VGFPTLVTDHTRHFSSAARGGPRAATRPGTSSRSHWKPG
jgi:hypothetical protein